MYDGHFEITANNFFQFVRGLQISKGIIVRTKNSSKMDAWYFWVEYSHSDAILYILNKSVKMLVFFRYFVSDSFNVAGIIKGCLF